jgi:hypothetical protein
VDKGNLKKSIAQKVYTTRRKAVAGLAGGKVKLGPHLHLVDKGTAERQTKSGKRTGRVAGMNFMEQVFNAHKHQAMGVIERVVAEELHQEFLKAGR